MRPSPRKTFCRRGGGALQLRGRADGRGSKAAPACHRGPLPPARAPAPPIGRAEGAAPSRCPMTSMVACPPLPGTRPGEARCRLARPRRGLRANFYLFLGVPFHPRREVSGGAASHRCEGRSGAPSGLGQGPAIWPAPRRARGRRRRGRALRQAPCRARRCPARQLTWGGALPGREGGQPYLPRPAPPARRLPCGTHPENVVAAAYCFAPLASASTTTRNFWPA
jgi:hypothetical protein